MVAKRLAACSGMDYAIMSGGDVGPLQKVLQIYIHIYIYTYSIYMQGALQVCHCKTALSQNSTHDLIGT
jgi:hypothetical protein